MKANNSHKAFYVRMIYGHIAEVQEWLKSNEELYKFVVKMNNLPENVEEKWIPIIEGESEQKLVNFCIQYVEQNLNKNERDLIRLQHLMKVY
jgi:hypothetical protein